MASNVTKRNTYILDPCLLDLLCKQLVFVVNLIKINTSRLIISDFVITLHIRGVVITLHVMYLFVLAEDYFNAKQSLKGVGHNQCDEILVSIFLSQLT